MNKRLLEIDYLRGLAIIAMIIIHTSVFFLSDAKIILYLWDYSQFAVPLFIFCSAYIFFKNQKNESQKSFLTYIKKRFLRLLKPYYIFMLFFFGAILIRDSQKLSIYYVLKSIFLVGGVDINWLVLLFLYFVFLMPLLAFTYKKIPLLFWLFTLLSLISATLFSFWKYPFDYRFIMWLPWSLIVIFSFLLVKFEKKKFFYILSIIISSVIFFLFRFIESVQHVSLHFYDNKYPPNIFFLSFGIFSIIVLFIVAQKNVFSFFPIKKSLFFLSSNSYSLFFIHYLFLYLISGLFPFIHFSFVVFFLAVFCLAIFTQWIGNMFIAKYLQ